jgi:hypothetical protein
MVFAVQPGWLPSTDRADQGYSDCDFDFLEG